MSDDALPTTVQESNPGPLKPDNPRYLEADPEVIERAHDRLAVEIEANAAAQFETFRFSVTVSAVFLGALAAWAEVYRVELENHLLAVSLLLLLPVAISLPSSLTLLNRARTRNRKAAYIVAVLDVARLTRIGAARCTMEQLAGRAIPWETALHLGFRRGRPHHAAFNISSLITYCAIELTCILFAGSAAWRAQGLWFQESLGWFVPLVFFTVGLGWIWRFREFSRLRVENSIQGFLVGWLDAAYDRDDENMWPVYLREYVHKSGILKKKKVVRARARRGAN